MGGSSLHVSFYYTLLWYCKFALGWDPTKIAVSQYPPADFLSMIYLRGGIQSTWVASHNKKFRLDLWVVFSLEFFTMLSMLQVFEQSLFLFLKGNCACVLLWLHNILAQMDHAHRPIYNKCAFRLEISRVRIGHLLTVYSLTFTQVVAIFFFTLWPESI